MVALKAQVQSLGYVCEEGIPGGLASVTLGFRELKPEQLAALEQRLADYFGELKREPPSAPGAEYRLTGEREEEDTKDEPFPLYAHRMTNSATLDVWSSTRNAGRCVYIVNSSKVHFEVESWEDCLGNARHATLYVSGFAQKRVDHRSPERRRKMVQLLDYSLPEDTPIEEVHQRVAEQDQSRIKLQYMLSESAVKFLMENFLPGYEITAELGYPEFTPRIELEAR